MSIKVAICDDVEYYIDKLASLTKSYAEKKNKTIEVTCFTDPKELLKSAMTSNYDILLLDIEMPELGGIELAKKVMEYNEDILFIFITNHPHFAYDATQIETLGYIQKPVDEAKFTRRMDNAIVVYEGALEHQQLDNLLLNIVSGYDKIQLHVKEIVIFEKHVNSVKIITKTGAEYKHYITFKKLEPKLNKKRFTKVNTYCIINMAYVKSIKPNVIDMWVGDDVKSYTISKTFYNRVDTEVKSFTARVSKGKK